MPQGMILRDENGNIVADYTTLMGRYLGFMQIPFTSGSISPAGADQGTLFAHVLGSDLLGANIQDNKRVAITVTSTTIIWTWPTETSDNKPLYHMMYGVY